MKCEQCRAVIEPGEEKNHQSRVLCEDCFLDALPMKTCDPWAVYSATSLERHTGGDVTLTPRQSEILRILKETGGLEREALLEALGGQLTMPELEREFATLRHMEKARGEKRGGKVFLRVW